MENNEHRSPDNEDRNLQTREPQDLGARNAEGERNDDDSVSHHYGRDLENHERYSTHAGRSEEEEGDREYFNKI